MTRASIKRKLSGGYRYGFHDAERNLVKLAPGLSEGVVREISRLKNEPAWMLQHRLEGLKFFNEKPLPVWGPDLDGIDFDDIHYYAKPSNKTERSWSDVPPRIKQTFERLGIPQAERELLAGVGAQYDSETVYHNLRENLETQGVSFLGMDAALKEHEDLIKKYFGSVVSAGDNKFAALNTACWSGGSFVHVPAGVSVEIPLQAYFRINAKNLGQFERTLILAEPGSSVHYIEGCSAPLYSAQSLHAAVVEIVAMRGARVRYTTIQNWSSDVYNLVTKRAKAYRDATVQWVDGNVGSRTTMKYPSILLLEEGARGEVLSIAFAGKGQTQDAGAKIHHLAPNTSSQIVSKSISKDGGRITYRGLLAVAPNAANSQSSVVCDALILDEDSKSETVPDMRIGSEDVRVTHEATVSKLDDEKLFYLRSRGFGAARARQLLIQGFIEPFTRQLPGEYAAELNRLIELEMEGAVG